MSISLQERQEEAQQKIERFVRRFEPSYRLLAYHAALPLVLTPELLNYLRVQFLRGEVPWVAEVDLLLSDLCRQVGYEQYAMDTAVRSCLLQEMKEQECGEQRMQEVAKLLISYVSYLGKTNTFLSHKELQAQELSAMAYLDDQREDAVSQLAEEFKKATEKVDKAELARLSRLTKELAPQLSEYSELIEYADLISELIINPDRVSTENWQQSDRTIQIKGIKFPNPYEILDNQLDIQLDNNLNKIKILILEVNPHKDLSLDTETISLIKDIDEAGDRNKFRIKNAQAVRPEDLHLAILDYEPQILHFVKHGTGEEGLIFEDETGQSKPVSGEALAALFELFTDQLECILLNSCYAQKQAEEIVKYIPYVIGMNQAIRDDSAIAFSLGFYRALGHGRSIEDAYKFGCNAIQLTIEDGSINRSAIAEEMRKLILIGEVSDAVITPEHLKPILCKKEDGNQIELFPLDVVVAKITFDKPPEAPQQLEFETVTVNSSGTVIKTETHQANYYEEHLADNIPPLVMMAIPEGEFIMGSPKDEPQRADNESPQHKVKVAPFWLAQTPITNAQWNFVANLPQIQRELNSKDSNSENDHPVTSVSWYDAIEFCARLSRHTGRDYRLPSEAEWEYACRAGTTTPFHFGATITSELANYAGDETYAEEPTGEYREKTLPVKSFSPNAFGLYDMHGQVWEWCADPWHDDYQNAPKYSRVWDERNENDNYYQKVTEHLEELLKDDRYRVQRGGSWDDYPRFCRSAFRDGVYPDSTFNFFGFRVACGGARTQ